MRKLYIAVSFFLVSTSAPAQLRKPVRLMGEVGTYFATSGEIPFWLRANQYGIVPREHALMTLRAGIQVDYHKPPKTRLDSLKARNRWADWGYAVNGVVNAGYDYKFVLPEAYVKVRLGAWEIWAGRRREIIGLADSTLGTGSYIWSGNSLPMLKIQLAIPEYWPKNGVIAIKGLFAHGWFEENRFVKNTLLHQKALYGRIGKPAWRLQLFGGFNHNVQWGGTTDRLPNGLIRNGQLPNSFRDYIDVITGTSLGTRSQVDTSRISTFDRENRIGNHLGTIDVGLTYRSRRRTLFIYRQSIYDDGSLYYLTNLKDGLNGISVRSHTPVNPDGFQIRQITLEYLSTYSQGGNAFIDNDPLLRGKDNYFNHSQYRDGWSRLGQTIGTPFITPSAQLRNDLPNYQFSNNNRVAVWHIGVAGQVLDFFSFKTKLSYSLNKGTYENPFPVTVPQFSGLFTVSAPVDLFGGVTATASFAADFGNLFSRNAGYYFSLRKESRNR
nr:capsule assembly Wzi family protein [uncultured Arsenicibacter sp.]